jgi:tetratricopeptide (TPR) repeat protein
MTDDRQGQVVTFYSFKGGTGRSMALANVAWILAANGRRVLVVDWDLESPGVHRFYGPFIDPEALGSTPGVIELIQEYEYATTHDTARDDRWHEAYARVHKYSFSLKWDHFPDGATLDFLSAGIQNRDYVAALGGMNWDHFYDRQGGGQFFDALRADMKRHYDFTLIDSRTGLGDIAEICTIHLPDILVDCFTLNDQGIEGAARVARSVHQRYATRNIRIIPVQMRIDNTELVKAHNGRLRARQQFAGLPADMDEPAREAFWKAMQVPYLPHYAYEETLATFVDVPGDPLSLLYAYETLTRYITNDTISSLPALDEGIRSEMRVRFERQPVLVEDAVTIECAPEDLVWLEWVRHVLESAGVRVFAGPAELPDPTEPVPAGRTLTLISQANVATEGDKIAPPDQGPLRSPLAVYLADVQRLYNIPMANMTSVVGLPAAIAADRILQLVGRGGDDITDALAGGPRYPGVDNDVFNVPVRNPRFTGRESELRRLRANLRSGGGAVVLSGAQPIALQGMGGIGKTQLAIEYAHRFRAAYDLVWWITADPASSIEGAMTDLAERLGVPTQPTGAETARAVLHLLARGEAGRWLLIFDNADELDLVSPFLPTGNGHVLITSRNPSWGDQARAVQVDVFQRAESVAHLRIRAPMVEPDEAREIAELLGDLPIAISAAGAWLGETGLPARDYIDQIKRQGPTKLVEATWDLSLNRLRERSPAAYRLLQLCSVLGPEISLELVYGDSLAAALMPFDKTVSERMVRGSLVQEIHRLALLRVDQRGESGRAGDRARGGQILVHRLLQHVVRSRMSEEELAEARRQVQVVLAASRPDADVDDPDTWQRFRMLWPHLEASDAVGSDEESVRRLLIDRVRYLWIQGALQQGQALAEAIVDAWTGRLETIAPSDRETLLRQLLHLRFQLGNIVRDRGQFTRSRDIDADVVEQQTELLGAAHPHTLMSAGGLAADLRGLGRYQDALELDQDTYEAWRNRFGEDHARTLAALNNLASSHRLMGDFRRAYELDGAAHRGRRIVHGENHPNTLGSANNLARDLRDAGEYERSAVMLRGVHGSFHQSLGPDSRGTLTTQANLAVSLRAAGHAEEATELLEAAYDRLAASFGPTSQETLTCRLSLALGYLAVEEYDRAEHELAAVSAIHEENLGAKHPHTLVCLNNRAMVARAKLDRAGARSLAKRATDGLSEVLGQDHPYSVSAQMNWAVCTAEDGDLDAALDLLNDAYPRMTRALDPQHPNTLRCLANLALVSRHLGRDAPASEASILQMLIERLGADHPAVGAMRERRYLHRIIDPHPF